MEAGIPPPEDGVDKVSTARRAPFTNRYKEYILTLMAPRTSVAISDSSHKEREGENQKAERETRTTDLGLSLAHRRTERPEVIQAVLAFNRGLERAQAGWAEG